MAQLLRGVKVALDGALPTNPHGGHLSGGYLHALAAGLDRRDALGVVGASASRRYWSVR